MSFSPSNDHTPLHGSMNRRGGSGSRSGHEGERRHSRTNSNSHSRSRGSDGQRQEEDEEIDLLDDKVDVFMSHARSLSVGSNNSLTSPTNNSTRGDPNLSRTPNMSSENPSGSTLRIRRVSISPVSSPRIDLSAPENVSPHSERMSAPSPRTVSPSFSPSSHYHPPVSHHIRRRSGGSGNIVPPLEMPLGIAPNVRFSLCLSALPKKCR